MTSRRTLLLAVLGAAATVTLTACSSSGTSTAQPTSSSGASSGRASSPAASSSAASPAPAAQTVRVTSDLDDGQVVGVGMPIVLNFDPAPTDAAAFNKAVTVTVNGQPASGAWYWEKPYADQPVQAHYREQTYWPADASIEVKLPIGGLSAGRGLAYGNGLTSVSFKTGDAHISTVNGANETMTVTSNGQPVKTLSVSLGKAATPTYTGTKIVMQKGEQTPGSSTLRPSGAVRMVGQGYDEIVNWSVRITASGEYVHAAPWNSRIGQVSTSNGCTNLTTADAEWFYNFAQLGDVVTYANTGGASMNPNDGLGDWNVAWGMWSAGGLLSV